MLSNIGKYALKGYIKAIPYDARSHIKKSYLCMSLIYKLR